MAASHGPEEKEEKTRPGFLSQNVFNKLTIKFDGKEIHPFSHPSFLNKLHQHATQRFQPESLNFLKELYVINQKKLTPEELKSETERLIEKYMSNSAGLDYLNITNTTRTNDFEARREVEGAGLTVFLPIIDEVISLIETNWLPEFDIDSREKKMNELHAAYGKDEALLPMRDAMCNALSEIEALEKRATRVLKRNDKEVDDLVQVSEQKIAMIKMQLKELLQSTMKSNMTPGGLRKILIQLANEAGLKDCMVRLRELEYGHPQIVKIGGFVNLLEKMMDPVKEKPANPEQIQKYMLAMEMESSSPKKEAEVTSSPSAPTTKKLGK